MLTLILQKSLKENPSGSSVYKTRFYVGYGTGAAVDSDISIDTVHWFHIAGTYDGYYLKIYVNGELKSLYGYGHTGFYENYDTTYIGRDVPTSSYFDGKIDDVRVYDWVLNQAQIWEIMCYGRSSFVIKDNSRVSMAWFDDLGNLFLKGDELTNPADPIPSGSFVVKNSTDQTVAYIDVQGNLWLNGDLSQSCGSCEPQGDAFIIKNSSDNNVAYIDFENGDLCLTGKLYKNPQ